MTRIAADTNQIGSEVMAEEAKGKRVRRGGNEWRALLGKFRRSELSVDSFCRREAISVSSFHRWRKRLADAGDAGNGHGEVSPAFVDAGTLEMSGLRPVGFELKLDLGGGLTLHLVRR